MEENFLLEKQAGVASNNQASAHYKFQQQSW